MIPASIDTAEHELRCAIERRLAPDVPRFISAYLGVVLQELKPYAPDDPVQLAVRDRVISMLDWADLMLRTQRSALVDDLKVLQNATCFLALSPGGRAHLHLDI